jgi:hypothetical protein
MTTIAQSGIQGNYTLNATVTSTAGTVPAGTVSFLDTSNGDNLLATADLAGVMPGQNFLNASTLAADYYPAAIVAADFNGDGIPDLAIGNMTLHPPGADYYGNVTVYLGKGDGTFKASSSLAGGASQSDDPWAFAVGDFNGDGILDLAWTNYDTTVTVVLGNGDGTFKVAQSLTTGAAAWPIVAGDFNGDGIPDLAVGSCVSISSCASGAVSIFLGNGDGTFKTGASYPVGMGVRGLALADLNGDGKADLVSVNANSDTLSVLLGNGDGTFSATPDIAIGFAPQAVAVGDFNGDGIPDLAVPKLAVNQVMTVFSSDMKVLLGNGDGTFKPPEDLPTEDSPGTVQVADLNGDGIPDLVVGIAANGTLEVFLGNGDGTFTEAGTVVQPTVGGQESAAIADFNGDGKLDIAAVDEGGTSALVFVNAWQGVAATASINSLAVLGSGQHLVDASYSGDANYSGSVSPTTSISGIGSTIPTMALTPSSTSITTAQGLTVTVALSGGSGNPTPTGSVILTGGGYTSALTALAGGSSTFSIAAGSLATGTDTLTANYYGDNTYSARTGNVSITVTTAPPGFTISGTAVSVSPGAVSGNTSAITVTPNGGFTGSVALTAAITSSPTGSQYPPTLSLGSTTPVSITGASAGTATLTISTTAPTTAALVYPERPGAPWYVAGGATLACLLLFGIPARRRNWRTVLCLLVLLVFLVGGVLSCGGGGGSGGGGGGGGGGNPGTTAGTYTVTVTGTSGSTTATGTVTLTVQ